MTLALSPPSAYMLGVGEVLGYFQAFQPFEPPSAIVILPMDSPLGRRGIGQGALGKVRSGTGRAQRALPHNRRKSSSDSAALEAWMPRTTTSAKRSKEKMRQEKQSAQALDRQPLERVRKNAPSRLPRQDPDRAGIIPGPQPLELV
jgi:hypothetical protein